MKLIKIDECNYTVEEKYFIPNNYELKCRLASRTHSEVYEVDQSFFTDVVKEAEYEIEEDLIQITFPVYDVITEIFINQTKGEVKVRFDYLPQELETTVKIEVEKFLKGVLEKRALACCDSCRHKHQSIIAGACRWVFWL